MQYLREFSDHLLSLYTNEFSGINLTRILDANDFYHKQIIDSVFPFENFESIKSRFEDYDLCLDIGFGGGFPLIPLAKIFEEKNFLGLEARGKKAKVVQQISDIMGLTNVKTFHYRSEELLIDIPCFITFKAVGTIQLCLDQLNCTEDVTVLFYKGPDYENEEKSMKLDKSWRMLKKEYFELPHGEKRTIVILEKNVPRGTSASFKKKKLKKLSEIIVDTER